MDFETLQKICLSIPSATEDIKWGADYCWSIGAKMFCVSNMTPPLQISLKVSPEDFDKLSDAVGIIPAPYLARHNWILVQESDVFSLAEWKHYITASYELVKSKLPKKLQRELSA